jgi:coiled-coil domain-containing protein 55
LFGDKDKFVTAAYKKKLEEDQKWLAEEKIREARDAKNDALKAGHMGNFYRCISPRARTTHIHASAVPHAPHSPQSAGANLHRK